MSQFIMKDVARSVPFDNSTNSFTSSNTQDAIEESTLMAEGLARFSIQLVMNGTLSNGDWVTYSNLTPDAKIVFPKASIMEELTWANSATNCSFDLQFYKNGITASELQHTYEVRSAADNFGYCNESSCSFAEGDWMRIKFIDQGQNPSDFVLVLWGRRIM